MQTVFVVLSDKNVFNNLMSGFLDIVTNICDCHKTFDWASQEEEQLLWVMIISNTVHLCLRVSYLLLMSRKARDPEYKYTIK